MSVLSRDALQDSPLADLHEIASALGIDGFRRLRKDDLVDTIIERQGGDAGGSSDEPAEDRPARSRSRRGGRSRAKKTEPADDDAPRRATTTRTTSRTRRPPGSRARARAAAAPPASDDDEAPRAAAVAARPTTAPSKEDQVVEGSVEILANGSGFIRVGEGESDGDVYISAAQVRRCELVDGDRVGGPVGARAAPSATPRSCASRRSTAHPRRRSRPARRTTSCPRRSRARRSRSRPRTRSSSRSPTSRRSGSGSRVSIVGPSGSGRTTTLRALAVELAAQEGIEVHVVLAGARPEELPEWVAAEPDARGRRHARRRS